METSNTSPVTPDPALVAAVAQKVEQDEAFLGTPKAPAPKNNSWSAIISIVIILAMVVVGAFYAWGQRITEEHAARAAQEQAP